MYLYWTASVFDIDYGKCWRCSTESSFLGDLIFDGVKQIILEDNIRERERERERGRERAKKKTEFWDADSLPTLDTMAKNFSLKCWKLTSEIWEESNFTKNQENLPEGTTNIKALSWEWPWYVGEMNKTQAWLRRKFWVQVEEELENVGSTRPW